MQYNLTPIERIIIPFEGKNLYGVLHLPENAHQVPCAILVPGLDIYKEDLHTTAQNEYVPRGMAALCLDSPGQGETGLGGLKATLDNFERAGGAMIDHLAGRDEVDAEKIVVYGVSWGAYNGYRLAARDKRVKALCASMGSYVPPTRVLPEAPPGLTANFMHVTGCTDKETFDQLAQRMNVMEMAHDIHCPTLLLNGEHDIMCPFEVTIAFFDRLDCPKEIRLYEDEFHSLGRIAFEVVATAADWMLDKLKGDYDPKMDNRIFVTSQGDYLKGDAKPTWWGE